MMHFLGEVKVWECTRCGRVFPIPDSLTQGTGSFGLKSPAPDRKERMDLEKKSTRPVLGPIKPQDSYKTQKKGA